MLFEWDYEPIGIGEVNGQVITVPKIYLLFGGMLESDLRGMVNSSPISAQREFLQLRKEAGEELTRLGITPESATLLLFNIGELYYSMGCREDWAIYAHKKVHPRRYGRLFVIFVVIAIIIYFIVK